MKTEKRKGRPPLTIGQRAIVVSFAVDSDLFEQIKKQAAHDKMTVSKWMREWVVTMLSAKR